MTAGLPYDDVPHHGQKLIPITEPPSIMDDEAIPAANYIDQGVGAPYASGTSTQDRRPALSITFSKIVIMRWPSAKVGYSIGAAASATRA